jgi:hypothetical protein
MKKLFLLLLLLIPFAVFGQESEPYPQPGNIFDIISDLNYWLSSTATVAGLTIFLTLLVATVWKTMTAIIKQIVALAIALILMALGNVLNIGFMAEFNVVSTVVYGLVVGFMANGLYDLKNIAK